MKSTSVGCSLCRLIIPPEVISSPTMFDRSLWEAAESVMEQIRIRICWMRISMYRSIRTRTRISVKNSEDKYFSVLHACACYCVFMVFREPTSDLCRADVVWQSCVVVPMFRQPVRKLPKIREKFVGFRICWQYLKFSIVWIQFVFMGGLFQILFQLAVWPCAWTFLDS